MKKYYEDGVDVSEIILPDLENQSVSTLVLVKSGQAFINKVQNKEKSVIGETCYSLTERELYGLPYIAGHIIHNLYRKIKNSKNWKNNESQDCIPILQSYKENNYNTRFFIRTKLIRT